MYSLCYITGKMYLFVFIKLTVGLEAVWHSLANLDSLSFIWCDRVNNILIDFIKVYTISAVAYFQIIFDVRRQ